MCYVKSALESMFYIGLEIALPAGKKLVKNLHLNLYFQILTIVMLSIKMHSIHTLFHLTQHIIDSAVLSLVVLFSLTTVQCM